MCPLKATPTIILDVEHSSLQISAQGTVNRHLQSTWCGRQVQWLIRAHRGSHRDIGRGEVEIHEVPMVSITSASLKVHFFVKPATHHVTGDFGQPCLVQYPTSEATSQATCNCHRLHILWQERPDSSQRGLVKLTTNRAMPSVLSSLIFFHWPLMWRQSTLSFDTSTGTTDVHHTRRFRIGTC